MGIDFRILPSRASEVATEHLSPVETAQINAYRKARAVAKKNPDILVLGADTVVGLGATLFGKPVDMPEAERMLARLQGRTHQVVTGVCLIHLRAHRHRLTAVLTGQIRRYLGAIHPFDKAGGYAIQEEGDLIVKGIHGSFTNVVGLPLEQLREELARWPD